MISISRIKFLAAAAVCIFSAAVGVTNANASQVCMNTSNGNGGSIAYYPYLFNNNTFGWSGDKNGSTECLSLNYTNGANNGVYYDGFGSTWNWPANGTPYNVKAYPSVVYGWQYGYTYSGLGLPSIIYNNKNVPTYQSYSITGSQTQDVLIDTWILNAANSSAQYAEVEIIPTSTFGTQTAGPMGTISIDGTTWYVSSANRGAWVAYNFIANNGATSGSANLNVKEFVNALVYDYGSFANNKYIGGTQIGIEIYQGKGGITFNPAAISVN